MIGNRSQRDMSRIILAPMEGLADCVLRDVLTRIHSHPASRIDELLPHRWQPSATAASAGK